jgi:integrase
LLLSAAAMHLCQSPEEPDSSEGRGVLDCCLRSRRVRTLDHQVIQRAVAASHYPLHWGREALRLVGPSGRKVPREASRQQSVAYRYQHGAKVFGQYLQHGDEASKNPCRDVQKRKRTDRAERKSEVGVDIPSAQEVGKIIAAASGRARPLIIVAAFTGLRVSELRGLTWGDVDLNANKLKVTQRADRFNEIGNTKSAAGRREVPFGTFVANTLKEWKLATRFKADSDFVFATAAGKPDSHANIVNRGFARAVTAALGERKYTGLHCLRHFYASWCISRGLPPKVIQTRLGHSTIAMTFDTYGHLFPGADDAAEIEAAELAVVSAS